MSYYHQRSYGELDATDAKITFALYDVSNPEKKTASATIAAGDMKVMKDEAAAGNSANLPITEGDGMYSWTPSSAELQCKRLTWVFSDQTATATFMATDGVVETVGNASAQKIFDDLSTATPTVDVNAWSYTGKPDVTVDAWTYTGKPDVTVDAWTLATPPDVDVAVWSLGTPPDVDVAAWSLGTFAPDVTVSVWDLPPSYYPEVNVRQVSAYDISDNWVHMLTRLDHWTVDDTTFSPTTTQFEATNTGGGGWSGIEDVGRDRQIIWITGNLRGAVCLISSFATATDRFTTTENLQAPANGDTFLVI